DFANRFFLDAALSYFMTFVLVLVRLSGLMVIGPYFAHTAIPLRVKALLVFTLALMITPSLTAVRDRGFEHLDLNLDGVLTGHETPSVYREAAAVNSERAVVKEVSVTRQQFRSSRGVSSTRFGLVWVVGTEMVVGMLLGLGVVIILSG